jgi:hypothetical protein
VKKKRIKVGEETVIDPVDLHVSVLQVQPKGDVSVC